MKKTAFALAFALALTACAQERREARCEAEGETKGTREFDRCVELLRLQGQVQLLNTQRILTNVPKGKP